jgi:hypothetical protein
MLASARRRALASAQQDGRSPAESASMSALSQLLHDLGRCARGLAGLRGRDQRPSTPTPSSSSLCAPFRRRPLFEALEQRLLLSTTVLGGIETPGDGDLFAASAEQDPLINTLAAGGPRVQAVAPSGDTDAPMIPVEIPRYQTRQASPEKRVVEDEIFEPLLPVRALIRQQLLLGYAVDMGNGGAGEGGGKLGVGKNAPRGALGRYDPHVAR